MEPESIQEVLTDGAEAANMGRGVIYLMTTVVPGLVKIGKTGTESFKRRMYELERNGYSNVVGLRRCFAIEVEDYDDKDGRAWQNAALAKGLVSQDESGPRDNRHFFLLNRR